METQAQMKVLVVKFISGEEIITKIVGETNNIYILKDPLRILLMPSQQVEGRAEVHFVPWVPFVKDRKYNVNRNTVVFADPPEHKFVEEYKKTVIQLYSNLVLPGMTIK